LETRCYLVWELRYTRSWGVGVISYLIPVAGRHLFFQYTQTSGSVRSSLSLLPDLVIMGLAVRIVLLSSLQVDEYANQLYFFLETIILIFPLPVMSQSSLASAIGLLDPENI